METDMGERIQEAGIQKALMDDWDLDLEALWHQSEVRSTFRAGRAS
jgi:hypothetical protein